MKRLISLLLAAWTLTAALAQNTLAQEQVTANYRRSASNHYAYPIPGDMAAPRLTPAPAGYEPFYIDHYGRHGSRWMTSDGAYSRPVRQLERADAAGVLTVQGKKLLASLKRVLAASEGRVGDLSDVGAEQHQGIARRMMENFPEVFSGNARIDARSTVIIRCILSMQNETMTMRAANPDLQITTDASYHDMHYMGWGYGEDTLASPIRAKMKLLTDSLYAVSVYPSRFVRQLIADTAYAAHQIDGQQLMLDVFGVAGILQSHHQFDDLSLFHYFTNDEIFDLWRLRNIYWYVHWANAPANGNRMPMVERALLRDMIEKADSAIALGTRGASLRFGHETCVLPLACLMELDNVNYSTDNLEELHLNWQDYNIIPKGCNIQMVFYRPVAGNGDILVKVLFNEHEAKLPVPTVDGPYCRWNDLREHYLRKTAMPTDWKAGL